MPVPEQPPGVEIDELGVHPITGAATSICAFVGAAPSGPVEDPVGVDSYAQFESAFGGLSADSGLGYAVQDFFANGGVNAIIVRLVPADGSVLSETDYVGVGFEDAEKGIYALAKADRFALLCLPPPVPGGDLPLDVWPAALSFCARRRAVLLVDPPVAATPDTVRGWPAARGLTGDAARNGAMYFPRIRRPDPLRNGAGGDFVPCGAVAGVIARTDADHGVWKAPSNAGLSGVTGLTLALTDGQNGTLNSSGINGLRTLPGRGPVVWGARTLRGIDAEADEFKYLSVRRLALYIEESIYRGTQWAVFEPNEEPLWAQLRRNIVQFMRVLFGQGAFEGHTDDEAYFVQCGRHTTMTQDDIDQGVVNILVGFAPVRPAEFVVIRVQQRVAAPTA